MKKRKSLLIIIILSAILIAATAILVGCSKEEPIETQVYNALQDVLNEAMADDGEADALLTETESKNGYRIVSVNENDTGVVVTFVVYAPDLYTVAKEIDENNTYETEEELRAAVLEAVSRAEIVEQEVTIEFIKTDNGYEPILTEEFFDAYYGGVLKLLDEAFNKKLEEEVQ